jgi:hypothetical protein
MHRRESDHPWAAAHARRLPPPWKTCDAVVSETFYLLNPAGASGFAKLLRARLVVSVFHLSDGIEQVLGLMHKYADLPMSLADACLVRMTEIMPDPILLTKDADFRIYRRNSRQTIPYLMPR